MRRFKKYNQRQRLIKKIIKFAKVKHYYRTKDKAVIIFDINNYKVGIWDDVIFTEHIDLIEKFKPSCCVNTSIQNYKSFISMVRGLTSTRLKYTSIINQEFYHYLLSLPSVESIVLTTKRVKVYQSYRYDIKPLISDYKADLYGTMFYQKPFEYYVRRNNDKDSI